MHEWCVPTKTIWVFPNKKSYMNQEIRNLLRASSMAFRTDDTESCLSKWLSEGHCACRETILDQAGVIERWLIGILHYHLLHSISGQRRGQWPITSSAQCLLCILWKRDQWHTYTSPPKLLMIAVSTSVSKAICASFKRVNRCNVFSLDSIPVWVLKTCTDQLAEYSWTFSTSRLCSLRFSPSKGHLSYLCPRGARWPD